MRVSIVLLTFTACVAVPDAPGRAAQALDDPTFVPVESGLAHGAIEDGMRVFRGLRYAAPPIGDLRWRDPEPPPPCPGGICEAADFGPICFQVKFGGAIDGSEDCLTANVFTPPDAAPGDNLPVLFFVHGGGLARGSAHNQVPYPPPIVVDRNVVVVTIQYRVNVFGFLAHHLLTLESGGSADWGLLDTIAALEWVQRNISAFGGDPDRVLLFGQSAGAAVVTMLMAAPRAAGLFAAAGLHSGPLGEGQPLPTVADCEPQGDAVATKVGCAGAADVLACMRAAPALDLLLAAREVQLDPSVAPSCVDVPIDGRLVVGQPLETIRAHKTVPLLIGENSREDGLDPTAPVTADDFVAFVHQFLDPFGPDAVSEALRLYKLENYSSPAAAQSDFFNDWEFLRGNRAWALAAADDHPGPERRARAVFKYTFAHGLVNDPGAASAGAFHGSELSFVFGDVARGRTWFTGSYTPTPEEIELTHQIEGYWARFAATGDPNGDGAEGWPKFQSHQEEFLRLDEVIERDRRHHVKQCKFLSQFNSHA